MTAQVILIDASPRRASDGAVQTVRLAGGGALYPYRYGGADYRAGIVQLPDIVTSLPFDGGDFGAGGVPQAAELQWAPASKADLAAMANYFWIDAPITVRIGDENADGTLPPIEIAGKVLAATVEGGVLKIALCDPAADLKKPLLTDRYGGTGDLDGPAEWQGKIKRRVWGRVWNMAGELIDRANNIYCWSDPARPLQGFDALRDKGAPAASLTTVAWQGSQAATLAALRAAAAPQGGGVTCPSIACVKWWTQPAGDLTADLRGEVGAGYVERTADIAARIVAAGPNTPFAAGTVAAANAARPAPVGWVAKDETTTTAAMIEDLLGHSSLLWLLNSAGEIVIREWAWGASAASAISQSVKRTDVLRPVGTRKLGYKRNETRMARGDLAAIVLASDVAYLDGTPIETLKPAQAGATAGAPAGTDVAGTPAEDVIAEQARVALGLTGATFQGQQLQDYVDAKIFVAGVPVNTAIVDEKNERIAGQSALAQQLDVVAATSSGNTASISSLQTALATPAGASATALFVLDVNGKVVGWKATNNGAQGILDLLFDAVIIRSPNGSPMFTASGGVVTMPNVKVNTLEVGTAVKPVRAAATSPVVGSGSSSSSGGEGARAPQMTASVMMTQDGWIEVTAKISQSFTDVSGSPWSLAIRVNGSELSESVAGGTVPGDVVSTQGAIYLSAGAHTVELMWAGRNTVTLGARSMFVKGFPFT